MWLVCALGCISPRAHWAAAAHVRIAVWLLCAPRCNGQHGNQLASTCHSLRRGPAPSLRCSCLTSSRPQMCCERWVQLCVQLLSHALQPLSAMCFLPALLSGRLHLQQPQPCWLDLLTDALPARRCQYSTQLNRGAWVPRTAARWVGATAVQTLFISLGQLGQVRAPASELRCLSSVRMLSCGA